MTWKKGGMVFGTIILLMLSAPMVPYKIATEALIISSLEIQDTPDIQEQRAYARSHTLYRWIPRHRSQIHLYDPGHWLTWGLFGNDDDGIFGEEPTACHHTDWDPSLRKAVSWTLRNPLHNFTFYVIGTAWRDQVHEYTILQLTPTDCKTLLFEEQAHTVFAGDSTGFYVGLHNWLPFLSFRLDKRRRFEFYLGWRERGNFGIKLVLGKKIPSAEATIAATEAQSHAFEEG